MSQRTYINDIKLIYRIQLQRSVLLFQLSYANLFNLILGCTLVSNLSRLHVSHLPIHLLLLPAAAAALAAAVGSSVQCALPGCLLGPAGWAD
jgi:hypothetical protein